ncbi:MAG: 4-hydroxy-tetrahydrodipicolinate synthase, partial [Hyphomicrobiaceae bacterium]
MFKGSYTALVTPFKDGTVDWSAFERFVEWQIKEGVNGIVPVGTTGESPTVDYDEHKRLIEVAVAVARKRVPVIAGTGSNSTHETIEMSQHARKVGADGVLIVMPYYNKPTQEGLYLHFKALSEAVDMPIIAYNVPSRVVVDMSVATMARIAELKNVVGVKDATANVARVTQHRVAIGEKFVQLSGEDATVLGYRAHGGHGCISV